MSTLNEYSIKQLLKRYAPEWDVVTTRYCRSCIIVHKALSEFDMWPWPWTRPIDPKSNGVHLLPRMDVWFEGLLSRLYRVIDRKRF